MTFLFGSPKTPSIPYVAPPKTPAAIPTQKEAVEEEKRKLTQGRKKRSTLLTGPQGVLEPADVGLKTLLGQ